MPTLAEKFFVRFAGLDRVYGRSIPDAAPSGPKGKVEGSFSLVKKPLTVRVWEDHLEGRAGVGLCPINDDGVCRWGCIDIDVYTIDHMKLLEEVKRLKLPLVMCRTKSGGAHLYIFFSEPVDAETIRPILMDWAVRLGHGGVEIFPKQGRLAGPSDNGSWLNLPYFSVDRTTRYAFDRTTGKALAPEDFLREAARLELTGEQLLAIVMPDDPVDTEKWSGSPPCLRTLAYRGFPEGSRNNALFNVAVYLRKRFGDDFAAHVDTYNTEFMKPPLPSKEVQDVIKSVGKKSYGYKCKDQPISSACSRQICLGCEFGIGGGNDDPGVVFGELQKILTDPVTWFWDVDGRRIQLGTPDMTSQPKFHQRCIEVIGKWPNMVKPTTWQRIVRERLERAEIVDVPKDSTQGGLVIAYLERFCTTRAQAKALDEILLGKAFTEGGRTYFRGPDFVEYLHRQRVSGVNQRDIYLWLKEIGATHLSKHLKGKYTNMWHVPEFTVQDKPFDVPRTDTGAPPF